jgi:AraC family transcriptional regulator
MFGENFTAIPKFWREYLNSDRMERLRQEDFVKPSGHYGVCLSEKSATGNFRYLIGMEVQEGIVVPPEYQTQELPTATYAVFSTRPAADAESFITAVYDAWAYIYGCWIPKSGVYIDGRSRDFEFYDDRSVPEAGNGCDLYVPVICRSDMTAFPDMADDSCTETYSALGNFAGAPEFIQSSPNTTAVNV